MQTLKSAFNYVKKVFCLQQQHKQNKKENESNRKTSLIN